MPMLKTRAMFATTSAAAITLLMGASVSAEVAQSTPLSRLAPGTIFDPPSSIALKGEGKVMHTALKVLVPPVINGIQAHPPIHDAISPNTPPESGYYYETPQSLACIYGLVSTVAGCNPNSTKLSTNRGGRAIAIVDAYDNTPNALSDLQTFAAQMGLPAPTSANFQIVFASGSQPSSAVGTGWDTEAMLDIQYAYGMAPKAKIYLVEAASKSFTDMFAAVTVASNLVNSAGGGEVSMSWGGSEYSGETSFDSNMTKPNVVYFASSGDAPGTEYPCVSPNVICVGGTSNNRNISTGNFEGATAWNDSGGGISPYESRPSFQNSVAGIVGVHRGAPDIAAVADPKTGVWVYDSPQGGWLVVGGTSAAAPVMAGIVNATGKFKASTVLEAKFVYATTGVANAGWQDITSGECGFYEGYIAAASYDFCTGLGAPYGVTSK